MNLTAYLKDKLLLFLLQFSCMAALTLFLCVTGYHRDACFIILFCWLLILMAWTISDYLKRKQYFLHMEAVLEQVDQRFLLGELMPSSVRLEDKIYRDMIRKSNRSVIERIRYIEDSQKEYREYIESWVHEIKVPITSISLMCENHKNELTKDISRENSKIENYVDMALYYARSDEVYKDYVIQETDLGQAAAEVIGKNKYYLIQNGMQVEIDCKEHVFTDKKWISFILNQIVQNSTKYRCEEHACIRITTEKTGQNVRLVVEDNGIGIKESEISRIFEKNFTGTNGRNCGRSTGMGLYLCQKLCKKLGIGISAESKEAVGTKIILEFPVSAYLSKL